MTDYNNEMRKKDMSAAALVSGVYRSHNKDPRQIIKVKDVVHGPKMDADDYYYYYASEAIEVTGQ